MSRAALLAVVAALWPQVATLQTPAPRDAHDPALDTGTAVVRGRVTDAETGAPLARVTVSLSRSGTRAQVDAKTGANGTFQFKQLPAGSYALTADPIGSTTHRSAGYGAIAGRSTGKHSTIVLGDGEIFDQANIALPRTYVISARVVDEDGEPVADMLVKADAVDGIAGNTRSRTTDDRGAVRLWGYSPGAYRVCAVPNSVPDRQEKEGFIRTCHPAATSDAEAQPVTFTNTDPAEVEIRIRRSRYFSISGVVLGADGQVAARATVSLVTIERHGGSGRSIQNEGGNFSVRGIAPGEYFIKAEMAQGANRRVSGYAVAHVQTADVENLVVALAPPPIIRGHLVFEGGPPPDPRTISVQPNPARGTISTMMGRSSERSPIRADMSFEFEGLVGPSTLRVRVPSEWVVKSVRYGGEERINVPTEFKSHIDPSALAIVLTNRPARLVARVLDEKGQPVEDARVIVFPADPQQWDGGGGSSVFQFGMPRAGTYEFAGLRPAEYLVAVMPDGMFFQDDDRRPLELLAKQAERITLLENDQKTIDLVVRR